MNVGLFSAVQSQPQGSRPGSPYPDVWAHFGSSAYAKSSALGAAVQSLLSTADTSLYIGLLWQADLSLGDASTLRTVWAAQRADRYGVIYSGRDFADGTLYRSAGATAATPPAYTVYTHSGNGPTLVDGNAHLLQHVDVGTGSNGVPNARVDTGSNVALTTAYARGNLGTIANMCFGGEDRVTGTVPGLGWLYGVLVSDDLSVADGAALGAAWSSAYASNPNNVWRAWRTYLATAESLVTDPDSNILLAQALYPGSAADYGTSLDLSGVTYTPAGFTP